MSQDTIAKFWEAMATNDFSLASTWLHPDFEYFMPQSKEYLKGRRAFAALNQIYPSNGKWHFDIITILSDGQTAVSDVCVTDGNMKARAITFHTLSEGLILRQKEFWPEDYPAPEWRRNLTQIMDTEPF